MSTRLVSPATHDVLQQLQHRMQQIEAARRQEDEQPAVSTGCAALDALLPAEGVQRGTLWEFFPGDHVRDDATHGSGAGTLAMLLAKSLAADGGTVVVMDRERKFYPPAAAALGIDWRQLLVVRANNAQDELWAIDQALRCAGVAAVWAPLVKLSPHDFRRLQLAAESGSAVGLLLRPAHMRNRPSWSHVQISVTPCRGASHQSCSSKSSTKDGQVWRPTPSWDINILRTRGSKLNTAAKHITVEIDEVTGELRPATLNHVTHPLHSPPALADSTPDRGTA